jgi:hypothetical protein
LPTTTSEAGMTAMVVSPGFGARLSTGFLMSEAAMVVSG